jgi:tyrosine-protein kinase Src
MGNKCCSKRQSDDFAAGYKAEPNIMGITHLKTGNSLDTRYTPDPNRSGAALIKHPGGIDIIRTGGLRRKLLLIFEMSNYQN